MPLQTKSGTTVGPVALICATICFIASGAMLVYLITRYPDQAEVYIRPLIPSLITLGAALVLWFRTQKSSEENRHISHQVADAAGKADTAASAAKVAAKGLNGDLDRRIEEAVTRAIAAAINREAGN